MNRIKTYISISVCLVYLLLVAGCPPEPEGIGTLTVHVISGEVTGITEYDVHLTGPGVEKEESFLANKNEFPFELESGIWDILVVGKADDIIKGTGEDRVEIEAKEVKSVSITLSPIPTDEPTLAPTPEPTQPPPPCTAITATKTGYGSITPSGQVVLEPGSSQAFTVQANPDYAISSITVDGSAINGLDGKYSYTYTFNNVRECHSIDVVFRKAKLTWTTCCGSYNCFTSKTEEFKSPHAISTASVYGSPTGWSVYFCNWTITSGSATISLADEPATTVTHIYGDTTVYPEYGTCPCDVNTNPAWATTEWLSTEIICADKHTDGGAAHCYNGPDYYDIGEKWLKITLKECSNIYWSDIGLWVKLISPSHVNYNLYLYRYNPGNGGIDLVASSTSSGYGEMDIASSFLGDNVLAPNETFTYYIEIRYHSDAGNGTCEGWMLGTWYGCITQP